VSDLGAALVEPGSEGLVSRRYGLVTVVNSGGTVDVALSRSGITLPRVPRLASYAPAVGDLVVVDLAGSRDRGERSALVVGTVGFGGAWTAYNPTWTTSGTAPVLGNGTLVGAYYRSGRLVVARVRFQAGSTTTFGTNLWKIGIPVTAVASQLFPCVVSGTDAGVAEYIGFGRNVNDVAIEILKNVGNSGFTLRWAFNQPFTWGSGDVFYFTVIYEAA
jgi:hypothetical protein